MAEEIKVGHRTWNTTLKDGSVLQKMRTMYPKGVDPKKLPYLSGRTTVVPVAGGKLANAGIKEFGTYFSKSGSKSPFIVPLKGETIHGVDAVRAIFNAIRKYGMKLVF